MTKKKFHIYQKYIPHFLRGNYKLIETLTIKNILNGSLTYFLIAKKFANIIASCIFYTPDKIGQLEKFDFKFGKEEKSRFSH